MKKSKLIGKILCLTLAIALVVSIVPGVSVKAEENGTVYWTEVTEANKGSLDSNLVDMEAWNEDEINAFADKVQTTYGGDLKSSNIDTKNYYIMGKNANEYLCLKREYKQFEAAKYDVVKFSSSELVLDENNKFYFYPQCTVTFDINGGNLATDSTVKTAAGLLVDLPTPTRDGYIFAGWFNVEIENKDISQYIEYNKNTNLCAKWLEQQAKDSKTWVRATTISDLESANLPVFSYDAANKFMSAYYRRHPFPKEEGEGIFGRCYNRFGELCYLNCSIDSRGIDVGYYFSEEKLPELMKKNIYYVLKDPSTVTPSTPAPSNPTPSTTPTSTPGSTSNNSSASEAPAPVLTTTNLVGEQISGWDAITKAISTQTKEKQQSVSGANQDLLHVDASTVDKTIPVTTVKAVSSSSLRGLHVFIGSSDAVTFLAKNDLSGYKETSFDHKDTITGHTRTIEFTHKQALGATVVFHTIVPVKSGEVTVYKVDANNNKIQIAKTISTVNGQVCFPITETATYVLEY